MLLLLLLLLLLWWRLRVVMFLWVIRMPWGIRLMVGMMRSSHTVQHGTTAKIVRSKLDHRRHWGGSATNRQLIPMV